MFDCKVCKEKEARIKDLLDQVAMLRTLATPPTASPDVTLLQAEVDQILGGGGIEMPEQSDSDLEAAAIMTGMYDSSQIEVA